ncbi:SANT and BTB domain regulator of class switch recombination [Zophobas morio]|uniref:SANT and BTB domain regulator of class switch recombination n=1 Tax=Zophobas morio TaxID=2755281 RepID=UPI0030830B2E
MEKGTEGEKGSVVTVTSKQSSNCSEITIKEFLDFLRTAYQLQDSLETMLLNNGMTQAVDWLKLKENDLVKPKETETEPKLKAEDKKDLVKKKSEVGSEGDSIKSKLNEVLSEGLLDSVLPYLVPSSSHPVSRRSSVGKVPSEKLSQAVVSATSVVKKKSSETLKTSLTKTDSEVEIHVCDEVKNMKKDFVCNQKLLVEKMGYFAEVTTGQRLEDMDISVHCDIGIFEWLMKWVKKDSLLEEDWPQLDAQCVVPILVSAAFLQMEPLQHDCLLFCHQHMNEILRTATNLSCLNDSILTRLAAMYTNTEVEMIKDRKDKIQSRIYTKLIQSLAEPWPESVRGHWSSVARVYRCGKCQQLVSPAVAPQIPCAPSCMQLQCDGSILSHHVRDPSWNINDYILKLHKALKTWRKVYWRLWGDAHFLYCTTCKRFFPAHQIGWCRHHPDPPQYFTLDAQKAPLPVGRYPCCGERAYRFQLLQDYSGCQFREHTVSAKDVRDSAVLALLENYRQLIEEEPPQLMFPERLTRLVARDPSAGDSKKLVCKENFWWEGFQIVPPRPKLGLLTGFANRRLIQEAEAAPAAEESSDECSDESSGTTSSGSSSSSSTRGSAESNPPPPLQKVIKRKRAKREGRLWQHNLSARSNQDIQRAYEENAIKEITTMLNRRTATISEGISKNPKGFLRSATPLGGIWVRLETEWKEMYCASNSQQKTRSIFTGKIRPKPLKM